MEDGGESFSVESEIGNSSSSSESEQGCSTSGFSPQQTYLAQVTLTSHYRGCSNYFCLVGFSCVASCFQYPLLHLFLVVLAILPFWLYFQDDVLNVDIFLVGLIFLFKLVDGCGTTHF